MKQQVCRAALLALVFVVLVNEVQSHTVPNNTFEHHNGNSSFQNILSHQNTSQLNEEGLQAILREIGFVNCSSVFVNSCNKCLRAAQLMQANGLQNSAEINQTIFEEMAPSILLHLLPSPAQTPNCTALNFTTSSTNDVYTAMAKKYQKSSVNGEVLDKFLEDVNGTELVSKLTNKPCFSAGSVLVKLEITKEEEGGHGHENGDHEEEADLEKTMTHAQYRSASVVVIEHLLSGFCIEESHHDNGGLPEKTFFMNKLLEKYGSNGVIKELEKVFKSVGIVKKTDDGKDDGHDAHQHRRRRRDIWIQSPAERHRAPRSSHGQNTQETNFERCYSADETLKIFGIKESDGIKSHEFEELCPSMIYQLDSKNCDKTDKNVVESHGHFEKVHVWGYGILAVTIISLLSLIGACAIPFLGKKTYDNIMTYFVAVAVGTLCGDGLIHLFPHSLGIHMHEGEHTEEEHEKEMEIIWKSVTVVAAIYAFYIFEFTMTFLNTCRHAHVHDHTHGRGLTVIPNPANSGELTENGMEKKVDELGPSIAERKPESSNILTAYGLMVIIGDVMHNVVDGIAIGVAFSELNVNGLSGGISTSIAIFCHELPHELGDFAVLVSSGLSYKRALLFNFLSACCCYLGLFIGIGIGEVEEVRLWAFAVTAGMFLYVSLVTVFPDMMRNKDIHKSPLRVFFLQNLGLLTGFSIMVLLSVYETSIIL